jgi:diamine N-acetyltransferase
MDIALRRTTANDLPYVLAAEGDDENRRFIAVWPEDKHRAALGDPDIAHLIIAPNRTANPLGLSFWRICRASIAASNSCASW